MKLCGVCDSAHIDEVNSYKHRVYVCNACGCVSHVKKENYVIERIVPRQLAKSILPTKAFLRLFSDKGDFEASDFYDSKSFSGTLDIPWRKSEVEQIEDQLKLINFVPANKKILDVSGGPGHVGKSLTKLGAQVTVTEYSSNEVSEIAKSGEVSSVVFDYSSQKIEDVVEGNFDLIMVRSSIIFCTELHAFVEGLKCLLNADGYILIETILPTLGEILWWQQLEYKFPRIYSEQFITKVFEKCGFAMQLGYKEFGNYNGVKFRSYNTIPRQLFTWLIDYPMVQIYRLLNISSDANIDMSLKHVMVTHFWCKKSGIKRQYYVLNQGGENKSKTFGYRYNGYLKNILS